MLKERKMADLFSTNNNLTIMRFEHQKQVAVANITARTIRIMELEEEIARMNADIEAQNKVIAEQDKNIQIQIEAKKAEKAEKETV
jgi:hypothetical protein